MRSTPPPADGGGTDAPVRCRRCGAEHPSGFTFCLECGERVGGHRFWPRSPDPIRRRALLGGCPDCGVRLDDVIFGFLDEHDVPASQQRDDDDDDEPARGVVEYSVGTQPTHECRQCGRQFWLVRSRWEGWRLLIGWRLTMLLRRGR